MRLRRSLYHARGGGIERRLRLAGGAGIRLIRQIRLEAFVAGALEAPRDTSTLPDLGSTAHRITSPISSPRTVATGSGTVVRIDGEPFTERTALDSKVRVTTPTFGIIDEGGHNIDPFVGLYVAKGYKYRRNIVLYRGRYRGRPMTAITDRQKRAMRMALADPSGVQKVSDGLWLVRSENGSGKYKVTQGSDREWVCDCEDFREWAEPCKHIYRAYLDWFPNAKLSAAPGEAPPVHSHTTQAWASYDAAQQEEWRLFHRVLRGLVDEVIDTRSGPRGRGRPPIPVADEAFCAIQKVYSHLSCRRSHGLIEAANQKGQVGCVPYWNVSSKFLCDPSSTAILHRMIEMSALPMQSLETTLAVDSTGFRTTLFGYYNRETHGERKRNLWLKAHAIVGTKTHTVVRVKITDGTGSDAPQFPELLSGAVDSGFKPEDVVADKGYLSRDNMEAANALGINPFIPFKRNSTGQAEGSAIYRKLYHYFQLNREEFDKHYHQRSNVESVFGAIKAKFGETLKSKTRQAQENELLAKIVAYNITVLVHEMFEHSVVPEFLMPKRPEGPAPVVRVPNIPLTTTSSGS